MGDDRVKRYVPLYSGHTDPGPRQQPCDHLVSSGASITPHCSGATSWTRWRDSRVRRGSVHRDRRAPPSSRRLASGESGMRRPNGA